MSKLKQSDMQLQASQLVRNIKVLMILNDMTKEKICKYVGIKQSAWYARQKIHIFGDMEN